MRAVVLEVNKKKAAVLSDDGMVTEVRNRGYAIGQSIETEEFSMIKSNKKWMNAVAGLAASLVIVLGGGALAYNTPVAQVSVDVNPSILYSVNVFDRVIAVEAINEEGDVILDTIDWDGQELSVVVNKTIKALQEGDFLDDQDWYTEGLLIGVNASSTDRVHKLIKAIKNELQDMILEETGTEVDLEDNDDVVIGIGKARVELAQSFTDAINEDDDSEDLYKVTPGKLNLVEKLYASDSELKEIDFANLSPAERDAIVIQLERSVKEIMADIKENRKGTDPVTEEDDDDEDVVKNGNGNAYGQDKIKPVDTDEEDNDDDDTDEDDEDDDDDDDDVTTDGGIGNGNNKDKD